MMSSLRGHFGAALTLGWLVIGLTSAQHDASAKKLFEQGLAFLQADRLDEAERQLRRVIEINPEEAQAYNLLGVIHDRQGRHETANAHFRKAIALCPTCAAFYNNLALNSLRQNKMDDAITAFEKAIQAAPDNGTAHYNLGLIRLRNADARQAVIHLEKARKVSPGDVGVLFHLAEAYWQSGEDRSSLAILEPLVQHSPAGDLPQVRHLLGTILLRRDRIDEAVRHLERAVELEPEKSDHRYKLAMAFQKKGELEKALVSIHRAIEMEAAPPAEYYLALGGIYLAKKDSQGASHSFRKALEIDPQSPSARFTLAMLLRDLGRYDEATEEFRRLRVTGPSDQLDLNLAMTHYLAEQYTEALAVLENARGEARSADYYRLLGNVYGKLNRWTGALESLDRAIELDSRNPVLYFSLGLTMINSGALAEAEDFFKQSLSYFPTTVALYIGLAQAQISRDRYSEAEAALRKALEFEPDNAEAHYLLGNCLSEMNKYVEARRSYQRAIELAPGRSDFYFSFGLLLETAGEYDDALREFEKVLGIEPKSATAYYRIGKIQSRQGAHQPALASLLKAAELNPEDPQIFYQLAPLYKSTAQPDKAEGALKKFQELKQEAESRAKAEKTAIASVVVKPVPYYLRLLK